MYYGTKLDHFIINQNQIRAYVIPFQDNPYKNEKGLIIEVDDTIFVPIHKAGTKLLFENITNRKGTTRVIKTEPHRKT